MPVDELTEEVLAYINTARILGGLKPLNDIRKGVVNKKCQCPVANSLLDLDPLISVDCATISCDSKNETLFKTVFNSSNSWNYGNAGNYISIFTPRCFNEFINKFDTLQYPQYQLVEE